MLVDRAWDVWREHRRTDREDKFVDLPDPELSWMSLDSENGTVDQFRLAVVPGKLSWTGPRQPPTASPA